MGREDPLAGSASALSISGPFMTLRVGSSRFVSVKVCVCGGGGGGGGGGPFVSYRYITPCELV